MTANWEVLQDPAVIVRLIAQLALFLVSALFSMSETALFSIRETDLQKMESKGNPQASRMRRLLDEPRQLIVSILCGNELVNIAATVNLAGILLELFGDPEAAALANTVIMLPLLLVLGEITPKTLAVTKPVMMATRVVEPVMTVWVRLVMPLRIVVRLVSDRITSLIIGDARSEKNILSADEFSTFLREVEAEGVVTAAERRLIVNLIAAGSTRITEIMVPRPQVSFIDADLPMAAIVERFRQLRHRRVPVCRGQRDSVIGEIKEGNLLAAIAAKPIAEIALEDVLEPATMVPTTQTVGELAEFFKHGDHHAVVVVNEFGGVEGLVSVDDVFGYLTLGRGVYLEAHAEIEEQEQGVYRCAGLTPISAFRRMSGLPIEDGNGVSTIGGLIMSLLNRLPQPGDTAADAGIAFHVLAMDNLLIDRVLIAPEGHPALTADAGAPSLVQGEEAAA